MQGLSRRDVLRRRMEMPRTWEYNEWNRQLTLEKPRLSWRWLFCMSGLLSPAFGIIAGHLSQTCWTFGLSATYASLWGLSSLVGWVVWGKDGLPVLTHKTSRSDIINSYHCLYSRCKALEEYSNKMLELVEPSLWPAPSGPDQKEIVEAHRGRIASCSQDST